MAIQLPGQSWQGRVNPKIIFVSPDLDEFEAFWVGDTRTLEKKIAIFDIPKFKGTRVIDNGVKADTYPITFYFSGDISDLEAEKFYLAAKQTGLWKVQHPVKGEKHLQLMTLTEEIQPVKSGNVTAISSQWIEPSDDVDISTVSELIERIKAEKEEMDALVAAAYAEIKQSKLSQIVAAVKAVQRVAKNIKKNMDKLNQLVTDVNTVVNGIQKGIQDLTAAIAKPFEIAARFKQLLDLPMLVTNDFKSRMKSLEDTITDTIGFGSESSSDPVGNTDSSPEAFNKVKAQELTLSGVIGNLGIVGATSDFTSRTETIEALEQIIDSFVTITNYLDTKQTVFNDKTIDFQYFSQSETFYHALNIIGLTSELLIRKSFELRIEKRFTLKQERTPVYLSMQEYGNIDSVDLFIESNRLSGDEVRLLPVGKEVVVYL